MLRYIGVTSFTNIFHWASESYKSITNIHLLQHSKFMYLYFLLVVSEIHVWQKAPKREHTYLVAGPCENSVTSGLTHIIIIHYYADLRSGLLGGSPNSACQCSKWPSHFFSNTNQSTYSTIDWVWNSQSEMTECCISIIGISDK